MTTSPTSAKEAALKIVMGEVSDLLTKAEDITAMLNTVHEQLNEDMGDLGRLVQRNEELTKESKEEVKNLAKYVESKLSGVSQPKATTTAPNAPKVNYWLPTIASALIASSIVAGGLYFASLSMIENATLGQRLQAAWPKLDKATQDKLNAAFAKN